MGYQDTALEDTHAFSKKKNTHKKTPTNQQKKYHT